MQGAATKLISTQKFFSNVGLLSGCTLLTGKTCHKYYRLILKVKRDDRKNRIEKMQLFTVVIIILIIIII